jgi:type II secretory pathway pseudopilin PulG
MPSVLRRSDERGYAMAALLVAMSLIAIALSVALPVYQTVARREREAELVFRGEQYARAIGMFQRKYGNALPPTVDVLVNEKFLRKKYNDPITRDDFRILGPGSPELAEALSTTPQQALDAQRGGGPGARSGFGSRGSTARGTMPQSGQGSSAQPPAAGRRGFSVRSGGPGSSATGGQSFLSPQSVAESGGGIIAVASKSTETSLRLYNGKSKYNEWIFMAVSATTAAGAPAGAGGQAPGGRGGAAPGGGRGAPAPAGPRGGGRRGFSPFGVR